MQQKLIWILGHSNIEGNDKVNEEARGALDLTNTPVHSLNSIVGILLESYANLYT